MNSTLLTTGTPIVVTRSAFYDNVAGVIDGVKLGGYLVNLDSGQKGLFFGFNQVEATGPPAPYREERSITGFTTLNRNLIGKNYHPANERSTLRDYVEMEARMMVGETAHDLGGKLVKAEGEQYASKIVVTDMAFDDDGNIRVDWIARFTIEKAV